VLETDDEELDFLSEFEDFRLDDEDIKVFLFLFEFSWARRSADLSAPRSHL
jgi:hypothetical protein